MQRVKVRLDTQKDVAEFVNIANTIDQDVFLVDNTYNRVKFDGMFIFIGI